MLFDNLQIFSQAAAAIAQSISHIEYKCWFHQKFEAINFNPRELSSYRQLLPVVLIQLIIFFTHTHAWGGHGEYRISLASDKNNSFRWVIFQLTRERVVRCEVDGETAKHVTLDTSWCRLVNTYVREDNCKSPAHCFRFPGPKPRNNSPKLKTHLIRSILVSPIPPHSLPRADPSIRHTTHKHIICFFFFPLWLVLFFFSTTSPMF